MVWYTCCIILLNLKKIYLPKGVRFSYYQSFWLKNSIPVDPFYFGLYIGLFQGVSLSAIYDSTQRVHDVGETKILPWMPRYVTNTFVYRGVLYPLEVTAQQERVYSLIVELPDTEAIYALAYNADQQVIARAEIISDHDVRFKYLLFDRQVTPAKIVIFTSEGEPAIETKMVAVYVLTEAH